MTAKATKISANCPNKQSLGNGQLFTRLWYKFTKLGPTKQF